MVVCRPTSFNNLSLQDPTLAPVVNLDNRVPLASAKRHPLVFRHSMRFGKPSDVRFMFALILTSFSWRCYITPLVGAWIADTYLGRFNTIYVAVAIALVGHIILIVSALPGIIEHSKNSVAAFVIALIVTGFGTGPFKSNISPLVAEQYRRTKLFIRDEKNGERVIVDPF
jgi:MFS family permease